MNHDAIIDSVITEFEGAATPIQIDCKSQIIRRLPQYKPFWETCAVDIVKNFRPDRFKLLRSLRGRINLDRQMVLLTMTRLLKDNYKDYLVASGESEDMATIVSSELVSLRIVL